MSRTTNGHARTNAVVPVDARALAQQAVERANTDVSQSLANMKDSLASKSADIKEVCENAVKMTEGKDSHVEVEAECQVIERFTDAGMPERIYNVKLRATIDGEYTQQRR